MSEPTATNDPRGEYFVPDAAWIASVQVGDLVPDTFGHQARVVEITARGVDITGRPYVCLSSELSATSQISGSFKVGELHRTMRLVSRHSSSELCRIERAASAQEG